MTSPVRWLRTSERALSGSSPQCWELEKREAISMVTPKIASLFSIFIGIPRFGNQLATRTEQALPYPLPRSFLSLAMPTLFNECARPAHHVLHVTKTHQVPMSASAQT